MRSPELNRLGALFAGADAGHYRLPGDVLAARAALARIEAAPAPDMPDEGAVLADLAAAMVKAAQHEDPTWPTAERALEARNGARLASTWQEARLRALEAAAGALVATVTDDPDRLLVECLRPALEDTLRQVEKHAAAFAPVAEFSDRDLLSAVPAARSAALAMDAAAARYTAIRTAQELLSRGRCVLDVDGLLSELRNPMQVWGPRWGGRSMSAWKPWPAGQRQRTAWLVTGEPRPDVWLPTPAERDARHRETWPGRGLAGGLTERSERFVGADR